jgi:hypothetical protein
MGGNIFTAIPAIMAEVGSIGKDRENKSQSYAYRGIEDFYNVLQPLMVKYKVFTVPNVIDQKREERESKSGGILTYTVLTIKYTFFADDGSSIETTVVGEGMDSGDKSSNKAMSVAHKYALAQIFAVPTKEMVDPEVDSPEPAPKKKPEYQAPPKAPKVDPGNPALEMKDLEAEVGRLAHLLSADTVTSAREQVKAWRDEHQTGDIEPYLAKLRHFRQELTDAILAKASEGKTDLF